MSKTFHYVCDKCSKAKFSETHETPEDWWRWGDLYFCSECFASLVKPLAHAIDDVQTYLGPLLNGCSNPERRLRVAAMITNEAVGELLKTLPRGEDPK